MPQRTRVTNTDNPLNPQIMQTLQTLGPSTSARIKIIYKQYNPHQITRILQYLQYKNLIIFDHHTGLWQIR